MNSHPAASGAMASGASADLLHRAAVRIRVSMTAHFRESGSRKAVVNVYDLSTHGFRLETFIGVHAGALVWLTLPGLEPRQASVVWLNGSFVGCRFDKPLHPAVLEAIIRRYS